MEKSHGRLSLLPFLALMLLASRCASAQLIAPKDEATADTTVSSPKRPVSAQAESALSIPVHDFTRNGYPLEVVRILAVEYRVVIGVCSSYRTENQAKITCIGGYGWKRAMED